MRLVVRVELRLVTFRVAGLPRMAVRVFPRQWDWGTCETFLAHRYR
jgi:hypothetical protein